MDSQNIIEKLKDSGLKGRGGAGFPAYLKWEAVKNAPAGKKYVICNGSEGEPGVFKDGFILENYPQEVIKGIKIAMETVGASEAIIYLRKDYCDRLKDRLTELTNHLPIRLFKETGGYLSGEETTLLNSIEGKREEPREKPPYPTEAGLYGCPTLINNVETFYYVAQIDKDNYKKTRFYSLSGDLRNPGVYELPENWTAEQILRETKNWPSEDFFVQSGGGASGEILTSSELSQPVDGAGAIVVYDSQKTKPADLMKKWIDFFLAESCGKCVPCREGVCRISEILATEKLDLELMKDILFVLQKTSFCPMGKSVDRPFSSIVEKVCKI